MDDKLYQLVEAVTETKTLILGLVKVKEEERQERKERQEMLDATLMGLEKRTKDTEDKVAKFELVWKITKNSAKALAALVVGVVTFNWEQVATNFHKLLGG